MRGSAFVIRKPVAGFAAGLAGADAVTFILGKGIPMPAGDPGHSAVLDAETGACLSGNAAICRRFEEGGRADAAAGGEIPARPRSTSCV